MIQSDKNKSKANHYYIHTPSTDDAAATPNILPAQNNARFSKFNK